MKGFILLVLVATPVYAEMYRCEIGGKTVYQDIPCLTGGKTVNETNAKAPSPEDIRRAQMNANRDRALANKPVSAAPRPVANAQGPKPGCEPIPANKRMSTSINELYRRKHECSNGSPDGQPKNPSGFVRSDRGNTYYRPEGSPILYGKDGKTCYDAGGGFIKCK